MSGEAANFVRKRASFAPSLWLREGSAGLVAAIVLVASPLTLGLLAYAPIGDAAAQIGIPAAFCTLVIGGLIVALRGIARVPSGGLSSAATLVIAGLVFDLAPVAALEGSGGVALVVAAVSLCVVGAGLLQLLFAAFRLGSLVKFVPQPVLAGFMLGVALLIVVAQIPLLLGVSAETLRAGSNFWPQLRPGALLVGLTTAVVMMLFAWRVPRLPAALVGITAGTLVDAALRTWFPALPLGDHVRELQASLPVPVALLPWLEAGYREHLVAHLPGLASTMLVLAILMSLETILGARTAEHPVGVRPDGNAELVTFGLANLMTGAFGGLPVVYMRSRAAAIVNAGGWTWRSSALCAVAAGALLVAGAPLLTRLPLAVLAGVMVVLAFGLIDRWTRELAMTLWRGVRSREAWVSLAIAALVGAVTIAAGFVPAVAVGVLVSMLFFMHAMNAALVRAQYRADSRPSRRLYPRFQEEVLGPLRSSIAVIGLEGALFFGNADRLAELADGLPEGTRFAVLDLARVTTIDATGSIELASMVEHLASREIEVLMAGVALGNRHGRALASLGGWSAQGTRRWFPDVDRAIEEAERSLLDAAGVVPVTGLIAFELCGLTQGMTSAQVQALRRLARPHALVAGERLFAEGDAGDSLYILAEGSITIARGREEEVSYHRFASFSPGMLFGEIALLDGSGRSADAIADRDAVVYEIQRSDLAALCATEPLLGERLYLSIAIHLARRLRSTSRALSDAGP